MITPICRVVGSTAACVFNELQSYASLPDGARPSIGRVATALGCSRSTVQRSIRRLVDAGYLTVENRYATEMGQLPSRYGFPSSDPQVITATPVAHLCPTPVAEMRYETTTTTSNNNSLGIVAKPKMTTKRELGERTGTKTGMAVLGREKKFGPGHSDPEKRAKADRIVAVFKRHRESKNCTMPGTLIGWRKTALIFLQEGRGCDEVLRVLKYILADEFWEPQIKDLFHLHDRYDQFRLMAERDLGTPVHRAGSADADVQIPDGHDVMARMRSAAS